MRTGVPERILFQVGTRSQQSIYTWLFQELSARIEKGTKHTSVVRGAGFGAGECGDSDATASTQECTRVLVPIRCCSPDRGARGSQGL